MLNISKTNYAVYSAIPPECRIMDKFSPVSFLKAIRNEQEIAGIHAAMQRDGVALVKFLKWLEETVPIGKATEISIDKKLHEFRAAQTLQIPWPRRRGAQAEQAGLGRMEPHKRAHQKSPERYCPRPYTPVCSA